MSMEHYKEWIKIGLNISYYRKERGLTQQQLAELSKISRNFLQRIENGKSASVDTLMDIANAMDIPPSKLLEFRD